jgi:hypothetical protein
MTDNTEAPGKRRTAEPDAPEAQAPTMTAAGFRCRHGARLIEGRRPASWLDDAITREREITRRMGLLDPKPPRGGVASA